MFSLLVALTMYLVLQPAMPALSVDDYLPQRLRRSTLPLAAAAPKKVPVAPVKKDPRRLGVDIKAKAAVVVDWRSGASLFEKNADEPLPIASITKLMTALVALGDKPDLGRTVDILGSDERPGGIPYLVPGEQVTVGDLLHLSLIPSANGAAVALARSTGRSAEEFVTKMNETAAGLGMTGTTFVDPTGLESGNTATARDVATLVRHALSIEKIREIASMRQYEFTALTGRHHSIRSTDELLGSFLSKPPYAFLGGKTGYLEEAGYCFGAAASNEGGDRVVAVVLGAETKEDRFREVKSLLYWAFDAYDWPAVARQ
jgi:D-alanyl-D-alanine carboxypeptidase